MYPSKINHNRKRNCSKTWWPIQAKENKPTCYTRESSQRNIYYLDLFLPPFFFLPTPPSHFLPMAAPTTKTSIFESLQRRTFFPSMPTNQSLPVSQTDPNDPQNQGLRRRLSSLSLKIQPFSSPSTSWVRRSKSMSQMGEYAGSSIRKWWDLGWSWIMSRRPTFARDLEMNDEENSLLGFQSRGTWRHVFYKVRSEFRKLLGSDRLPTTQTFSYDSFSYAQNFDDGKRRAG